MNLKTVAIIGSTGSIGTQTIEALNQINALEKRFEVIGISAKKSDSFLAQLNDINPLVYSFEKEVSSTDAKYFEDSAKMIEYLQPDICVIASGGSDTLRFSVSAVKNSTRVCLANKESLVMAGSILKTLSKEHGSQIVPIDSEHSSVFQLIHRERLEDIDKVIITASGGALRDWPLEKLKRATVEDVLKHPNWKMGKKITVDSATLFNKGLEVIEAVEYFDLKKEQIKTAFCYSSYIHAIAIFKDGSIKIHAGEPNMLIPIAYSLTYPERLLKYDSVDFQPEKLDLRELDVAKYPALELAYEILEGSNSKKIAYNASNEIAVQLFLEGKIPFTKIFKIVKEAVEECNDENLENIEDILNFNEKCKRKTNEKWRG